MTALDATHDPALQSWVESANAPGADFTIQNLPYGRFRRVGTEEPLRMGVAIGDQVLDLRLARELSPWGEGIDALLAPLAEGDLIAFMDLGPRAWKAVRAALSHALAAGSDQGPFLESCLLPRAGAAMALPCTVGEYTDFYSGLHHASAVGRLFRPDQPLLPNYKWVPVGYHGRASSVVVSGTPVQRPLGQIRPSDAAPPELAASRRLDFELELGALVAGGNALGEAVPMAKAEDRVFGLVLLNDWSARDIQAWEYQPLGPFLSKNFGTSLSPWVVTLDALAPFRRPFVRPAGDPQPLPYLDSPANRAAGAFDIGLGAWLQTAAMRQARQAPQRLMHSNAADAYWTLGQLVTHHTVGGCNLRSGDLLGTGTLSGPAPGQGGSLLELSEGGRKAITLAGGEQRLFLEDGDTVVLRGVCQRAGARRIGFGSCHGTVLAARAPA
ncbi:Fumarylacetoacetase [Rubrivivax sp. A210]|uniref:fumarylacetoacetase n=1 Tax=Rubrivivax sp. A210 TaxID=2772301 RepID=UPI00191A6D1E|nr:fumarylacetoacetase [Rubrivivax sp. A210]CAD5375186.1 Fumarylacetoacetase [Rubrivivax sp. A210]